MLKVCRSPVATSGLVSVGVAGGDHIKADAERDSHGDGDGADGPDFGGFHVEGGDLSPRPADE